MLCTTNFFQEKKLKDVLCLGTFLSIILCQNSFVVVCILQHATFSFSFRLTWGIIHFPSSVQAFNIIKFTAILKNHDKSWEISCNFGKVVKVLKNCSFFLAILRRKSQERSCGVATLDITGPL